MSDTEKDILNVSPGIKLKTNRSFDKEKSPHLLYPGCRGQKHHLKRTFIHLQ